MPALECLAIEERFEVVRSVGVGFQRRCQKQADGDEMDPSQKVAGAGKEFGRVSQSMGWRFGVHKAARIGAGWQKSSFFASVIWPEVERGTGGPQDGEKLWRLNRELQEARQA